MADPTHYVEVVDIHGRVCDPVTGNALGEGQEGPGSIFHVPVKDPRGDYQLYISKDETMDFSKHMQMLRDAGFQGGNIFMHATPRPQDIDRIPSPPPSQSSRHNDSEVGFSLGNIYRTECAYCWAILRGKERQHGFKLHEIQLAARKGCSTCDVLQRGITTFADLLFPTYNCEKVRIRQEVHEKKRLLSDSKNVTVCFDEYEAEVINLAFVASREPNMTDYTPAPDSATGNSKADSRILDTSSYETVSLIKNWIHTCSQEHHLCAIAPASVLPVRVLEVSNYRAKLVETKGKVAPYLTLSHCWGTKTVIRLVKDKLDDMKRDIPWTSLSRTFQDAIMLTWRLGFRYIWIDSLCILQDSKEDWEYHASRMAQIYSNSQLTISASGGADSSHGCFSSRLQEPYILQSLDSRPIFHPPLWTPKELEGKDRDGCVRRFQVTLKPRHGLYQDRRPSEPLLKRAWVFQEQILSPRIVHFASGELYFECKSHLTCECSGWSLRSESHQWETRWRKAHAVLLGQESTVPKNYFTPETRKKIFDFEAYRAMIETYTELDITEELDRLPALSGVTFGRKDEYLAGIWKSMLIESLHWYPVSKSLRGTMARRPAKYRAPTWSWASVEAPIRHRITDFYKTKHSATLVAEITHASVTLAGVDPRGRVSDGCLRIQGPMRRVQVTGIGICERKGSAKEEFQKRVAQISDAVDKSLAYRGKVHDLVTYATIQSGDLEGRCLLDIPLALCRSQPAEVSVGQQLVCLMISSGMSVVLKAVPHSPGSYTRVGLFEPETEGWTFRGKKDETIFIV